MPLKLYIVTFGHKYNELLNLDMLIDARVLPNPYYVDELKELNGLDDKVYSFVINNTIAEDFLEKVKALLDLTLESAKNRVKEYYLGIACTGGQHRSVAVAEYLKKYYKDKYEVHTIHKELR